MKINIKRVIYQPDMIFFVPERGIAYIIMAILGIFTLADIVFFDAPIVAFLLTGASGTALYTAIAARAQYEPNLFGLFQAWTSKQAHTIPTGGDSAWIDFMP